MEMTVPADNVDDPAPEWWKLQCASGIVAWDIIGAAKRNSEMSIVNELECRNAV